VYTIQELLALSRIGHGIKHPIPTELRKLYRGCKNKDKEAQQEVEVQAFFALGDYGKP